MTDRKSSNVSSDDESGWTPEYFLHDRTDSLANPLTDFTTKLLEPSTDIYHSRFEGDIQPLDERSEYEIIEQIVSNFITSYGTENQNAFDQNANTASTPRNGEQVLPENTNTNYTPLLGSESNHGGWIQSNELTEENLTHHQIDYSSLANCAVNSFYWPICSYVSVDGSQVQNHFYAICEESMNFTTCQAPARKTNSYFDCNVLRECALNDEFTENIAQGSQNVGAKITSTWESEKSKRKSTEPTNPVISSEYVIASRKHERNCNSLIPSNHLVDRRINESTPTASNNSLFHSPPCRFDAAGRPLDRGPLHPGNEENACSSAVCSAYSSVGDISGKNVCLKENLLVQQMNDTDENSQQCDKCGDKFASKFHLNVHRRMHIEEKRFRCKATYRNDSRLQRLPVVFRLIKRPFQINPLNIYRFE
nr:RB associated KRAB zinc finger protein [Hymenolepis microstoma]